MGKSGTDLSSVGLSSETVDQQLHEIEYLARYLRVAKRKERKESDGDVVDVFNRLLTLYENGIEAVRFKIINEILDLNYGDCTSLLLQALRQDPSPLVRHEAAFGLEQKVSDTSAQVLIGIGMNDPSSLVRHEAAMALAGSAYGEALPVLQKGLHDPNPEVVASCQIAIASIKYEIKSRRAVHKMEEPMVKEAEIRDRFHKPEAGEPPYYMDDISVVFIDLVQFSSQRIAKGMHNQIRELQDTLHTILDPHYFWDETHADRPNRVILIPTGDGYAIAFHKSVDRKTIISHADELYKRLVLERKYKVRIGISRGPHYLFVDLNRTLNLIGEGIIRAQRAMMLANPGQILCTAEFAEGIESEIEGRLEPIEGEWQVKGERPFRLFNYRNRKIGEDTSPDEDYRIK